MIKLRRGWHACICSAIVDPNHQTMTRLECRTFGALLLMRSVHCLCRQVTDGPWRSLRVGKGAKAVVDLGAAIRTQIVPICTRYMFRFQERRPRRKTRRVMCDKGAGYIARWSWMRLHLRQHPPMMKWISSLRPTLHATSVKLVYRTPSKVTYPGRYYFIINHTSGLPYLLSVPRYQNRVKSQDQSGVE
jgi:hypothetical protein